MQYIEHIEDKIPEKRLRFSKFPRGSFEAKMIASDLAYNIRILIETFRDKEEETAIRGLEALDYAYTLESTFYLELSKKYKDEWIKIRKEREGG
tara:strand:- start:835 stop:1116 length:282 start_codon:yes stop_codon:yes gene_type:complete